MGDISEAILLQKDKSEDGHLSIWIQIHRVIGLFDSQIQASIVMLKNKSNIYGQVPSVATVKIVLSNVNDLVLLDLDGDVCLFYFILF
jgi:hypothetical protein